MVKNTKMSVENDKRVIREAKLSDRDAVLKIRENVYGGRDYLTAYYDAFLTSGNAFPYVTVIDGQIVAFFVAFLVDDKRTFVGRAGRTNPKHAGNNLVELMYKVAIPRLIERGVMQHKFIKTYPDESAFYKQLSNKELKHILQKEFLRYTIRGTIPSTVQTKHNTHIPEATNSDMIHYMSTEIYRKYLFPHNVLIVDLVPYELIQSNLEIIRKVENRLILSDVRIENGSPSGMVSIATLFQCSAHFYGCNLDLYGLDTSTFKQHLIQCVEFIISITKDKTSQFIFVDSRVDKEELRNTANSLGLDEIPRVDGADTKFNPDTIHLFKTKMFISAL